MSGIWTYRVFGVIRSDGMADHLSRALHDSGFAVTLCPASQMARLPRVAGPIVLDMSAPPPGGNLWSRATLEGHIGPCVGVARACRHPDRAGDSEGFFILPSEAHALVRQLRWSCVAAIERRLLYTLGRQRELHIAVQAAVRHIVTQRPGKISCQASGPTDHDQFKGGRGLIARLAAIVGISPDHLSRIARRHGMNLSRIDDYWRLGLAVVLRDEKGSWEKAAWCMGYEYETGIVALVRRTMACRPTDLSRNPVFTPGRWEEALLDLVLGRKESRIG